MESKPRPRRARSYVSIDRPCHIYRPLACACMAWLSIFQFQSQLRLLDTKPTPNTRTIDRTAACLMCSGARTTSGSAGPPGTVCCCLTVAKFDGRWDRTLEIGGYTCRPKLYSPVDKSALFPAPWPGLSGSNAQRRALAAQRLLPLQQGPKKSPSGT
jgi:hypothetical protein